MLQRSDGADLDTRSSGAYPDPLISLEKTHEGQRILCVDISPDDRYAAIGLINGSVIIYDMNTYDMVTVLHPGLWVWDVKWKPVGTAPILAVGIGKNYDTVQGGVKIYSGPSWELIEYMDYGMEVKSISWRSDGSLLAVPNLNLVDLIWTSNWTRMGAALLHNNYTYAVEWHPHGDLLAVGKNSFDHVGVGGSVDILDANDDFSVFSHIGPFSFTPDVIRWGPSTYQLGIGNGSVEVWNVNTHDLQFNYSSVAMIWINGWEWVNGRDGFFVANNSKVDFIDPFHPWNNMYISLSDYVLGISLTSNNSVLLAIAYDTLYFLDIQGMDPSPHAKEEDLDGDGVLDENDDFPTDPAASEDSDGDGYPNEWNTGRNESDSTTGLKLDEFPSDPNEWADSDDDSIGDNGDRFPYDPAASVDSDGDGYPDEWNPGMSENDSTTGLKLDEFPMDSTEWVDTDRDGRGDNSDVFPHDPGEWADTDEDGVGNNGDAFPTDPAASVDTDGDRLPDKWNPGMSEADSTTGLKLDRYPLDPKNLPDRNNSLLSSPWTYLPIILITLTVIFILAVVMIVRGRKISNQHLNGEEERIRRYREGILNGHDDPDFEITDEELIEALSRKRKSGEISDETLTYIIENVVGDR